MNSIDPDDFGYSPFLVAPEVCEGGAQRGGLGNVSSEALSLSNGAKEEAQQLFGEQLPVLLEELNSTLAA